MATDIASINQHANAARESASITDKPQPRAHASAFAVAENRLGAMGALL